MTAKVTVVGSALAAGGIGAAVLRYRRDLASARERLASEERSVFYTDLGSVEFAERGRGDPLLVSHGVFHGFDGGLLTVEDLLEGSRVLAPSRFGYLGSSLPVGASGAAQADAFVALLDHLALATVDVLAISAGTSPAVQLALRHPHRVDHLIICSGSFPGSQTAEAPPSWAKLFYNDPAMWILKTFAPSAMARLMGVPRGFPRNADDERTISRTVDSVFPVGPRVAGAVHDAFISNPEINDYPLEELGVPTLLIHAKDDPLTPYGSAVTAAARIPGSTVVTLDSGGHLQLGQSARVRAEIDSFRSTGTAATNGS